MLPSRLAALRAHEHEISYRICKKLSHLGDPAILLPLSIAVMAALLWKDHRPTALRFGMVVAADLLLTLLSKLWFYAGGGSTELNILTPSGHVSLSVTFYGCVAFILASQRRLSQQVLIIGVALFAVLVISVSRIVLYVHTPEEVVFGSLIGGFCVIAFSKRPAHLRRFSLQVPIWVLVMIAVGSSAMWAIGRQVDTEVLIQKLAAQIGSALGIS